MPASGKAERLFSVSRPFQELPELEMEFTYQSEKDPPDVSPSFGEKSSESLYRRVPAQ